jgi:multiple sugar transport system ATP-binding protein
VAEILQIDHLLDRKPANLSGGQRQRVAMGRALVRDPSLFLFDEPLSNLDAKLRVEMRAEIKRLHRVSQSTIVYVTHDQIEAMTLATRIVVLKNGLVQQIGTPSDIYRRPANTFVADFMGSPPMNLLSATVDPLGLLLDGGTLLPFAKDRHPVGRKLVVGVRPEDILPASGRGFALTVQPVMVENTGADAYVTFRLGKELCVARLPGRYPIPPDGLALSVAEGDIHIFDPETGGRLD